MSELTEEDKKLFNQAMQGVLPKKPSNKATPDLKKPRVNKRKIQQNLDNNQLETESILAPHSTNNTVSAHQRIDYFSANSRPQDLHKLKAGKINTTARLDLHGYTEETALEKLKNFINSSHNKGHRYLLVIHGKGYNSDTDYPTIKNLVHQFLPSFPQVLGYCSAQQKDGGTGAVYIWLKKS